MIRIAHEFEYLTEVKTSEPCEECPEVYDYTEILVKDDTGFVMEVYRWPVTNMPPNEGVMMSAFGIVLGKSKWIYPEL